MNLLKIIAPFAMLMSLTTVAAFFRRHLVPAPRRH